MIVIDANLLLYAYTPSAAVHRTAKSWLERTLSHSDPIGIPWQSIAAFLRIATNPSLGTVTMARAVAVVEQWLALPQVRPLAPGEQHWPVFQQMLLEGQVRGPLASDAHLAALTLEYGGTLYSADRDFSRFPGLRWINPLAP